MSFGTRLGTIGTCRTSFVIMMLGGVLACDAIGVHDVIGPNLQGYLNQQHTCPPNHSCVREMTPEEMERAYELFAQWSYLHAECAYMAEWFEDTLNRGDVKMFDSTLAGDSTLTGDWFGYTDHHNNEIHLRAGLSEADFKKTVIHESYHEWKTVSEHTSELWNMYESSGYCLSW